MTDYVLSHDYEFFIRNARSCDRDDFGAKHETMLNLIHKETDSFTVKHLNHKKLLETVKKCMISATKFALTRKFDKADKVIIKEYLDLIQASEASAELLAICKHGKEVFAKLIPNSDSI